MKRVLVGLMVLGVSGPAFAADDFSESSADASNVISGDIGAYFGGVSVNVDSDSQSATAYGGEARINSTFATRWNFQGDLFVDALTSDGSTLTAYGATAHIYWRDPSAYALGGFMTVIGYNEPGSPEDITQYFGGPEAQYYLDNITLYGQLFAGQFRGYGDTLDELGARGEIRYFFNDNLRLDGEIGYTTISTPSADVGIFTAATEIDYRFADKPLTAYGRYQFDTYSVGGSDIGIHKFIVGLRASFGSKSLLDQDRNGATMDTYRLNVPTF